jgi:hypothetical protein
MPGMFVYDWQMNEGRSETWDKIIWNGRAKNFKKWGLDIQALTAPSPDPVEFIQDLSCLLGDYTSPLTWRADSHAWAGIVARDMSAQFGPLSVVNFDAHHDLGYESPDLAGLLKSGSIHCDDWALIGLAQGWIKNYTVVYPDWLGKKEWGRNIKRPWLKEFRSKIKLTTWGEYKQRDEIPNVEGMFFCRSSSWVPPWLDGDFTRLHEEIGYAECLDCASGQKNTPFDTCKSRSWDWAEFERDYVESEERFRQLAEMNKALLSTQKEIA